TAGQIDAGRVDKHAKAPGGLVILVVNPSTRSFLHVHRRGRPPNHPSGWKRLIVRYERKGNHFLAFLGLAAALTCHRRLEKLTT
ncbi:hypothetical protein ACF1FZ_34300, partial [Streptomyces sp. NPDC014623]